MSAKWVSLSAKWVNLSAKLVNVSATKGANSLELSASMSAKWAKESNDFILITKFLVGWKPLEVENKPYRTIPVTFLPRLTPQFALCQIDSDSLLQWVFTIDYLEKPKNIPLFTVYKNHSKTSKSINTSFGSNQLWVQFWINFMVLIWINLNQFYIQFWINFSRSNFGSKFG